MGLVRCHICHSVSPNSQQLGMAEGSHAVKVFGTLGGFVGVSVLELWRCICRGNPD